MAAPKNHWVLGMFAAGDSMDVDAAMSYLAEDIVMRVANNEPTTGLAATRAGFIELTSAFTAIHHEVMNVYDVGPDLTITECRATYTLRDGRKVWNYSCNHLRHRDGKVYDNRIFMDPSPFFS